MILKIQFCPGNICICTLIEEKNHANRTVCCVVTERKMQVFQKTEAAPVQQLRTKTHASLVWCKYLPMEQAHETNTRAARHPRTSLSPGVA